MNITLLTLYHPMLKMSITLKRTPEKKYIYSKQITPVRNIWTDQVIDDLESIKGDMMGEIINGYEIKQNMLGMDFIDDVLSLTNIPSPPKLERSPPKMELCD